MPRAIRSRQGLSLPLNGQLYHVRPGGILSPTNERKGPETDIGWPIGADGFSTRQMENRQNEWRNFALYEGNEGAAAAACGIYPLFYVFWRGKSHLSALFRAQAGNHSWLAFSGFALSAIGFPILGVVAVARSGGLPRLAGRAEGLFSAVFTLFIYLSIGPCLAIPRTASTSFEMAVAPFLSDGAGNRLLPLCYSLIFFAVAFLLALHPEKLTDRLGKVLCPVLLALILAIFLSCILHPVGNTQERRAPMKPIPGSGFWTAIKPWTPLPPSTLALSSPSISVPRG